MIGLSFEGWCLKTCIFKLVPYMDFLLIKNSCRGLTRPCGSAAKLPKGSEKAETLRCLLT